MTYSHFLTTRYSDTAQDGIIHHSSYIIYLEEARITFLRSFGIDINEFEKNKIISPVIDLSIKYLKPVMSSENITVVVSITSFTKVRFHLKYLIYSNGIITTEAQSSHCFLNELFKPIALPQKLYIKLSELYRT